MEAKIIIKFIKNTKRISLSSQKEVGNTVWKLITAMIRGAVNNDRFTTEMDFGC